MVVRKGYGNECSLMIATRRPGYHTKPHQHESEQINYVLEGEIWFFVKDKGFLCKKGDFHRIPANTVHWAFNRSDQDATVAEAHPPGLIGGRAEIAPPLYLTKARNRRYAAPEQISSSLTTRKRPKPHTLASKSMVKFSVSPRFVFVLFVLLVVYSSAAAQELRRIHYGTTTSTAHLPIWVAKDAGLFVKNGLNVEPIQIRGGALITMGIMSGQLQFSGAARIGRGRSGRGR